MSERFWRFVHNAIVHPMMGFGEAEWLWSLHQWSAAKWNEAMMGAGK